MPKQVVHSYATSIQGINAYIITEDYYILAALERGQLKGVSGAVDEGDNVIKTINKELEEEIGFKLNNEYKIYFLSGHIINKARDNLIADNFHSFIIKVNNTAKEILETFNKRKDQEITGIGFFNIKDLLNSNYNVYFNSSKFELPENFINSRFITDLGSFLKNEGSVLKIKIQDKGEKIKILNEVEKLLDKKKLLPNNMGSIDLEEMRRNVKNLRGGKLKRLSKRKKPKKRRPTKRRK